MMNRAPDRRPTVVLFDVFETLLDVRALGARFVDVGRSAHDSAHDVDLFFARTLRDGMAFTLAGEAPAFAAVAHAVLSLGWGFDDEQCAHVLAGFAALPAQPDAGPALQALADAGVRAHAFTHGSADAAHASLVAAGLRPLLGEVVTAQSIRSFKPPRTVYEWACAQVEGAAEETALVAVHSWDTHGAVRAGLLAGLATRFEGGLSPIVEPPHAVGSTLDEVVALLLSFDRT